MKTLHTNSKKLDWGALCWNYQPTLHAPLPPAHSAVIKAAQCCHFSISKLESIAKVKRLTVSSGPEPALFIAFASFCLAAPSAGRLRDIIFLSLNQSQYSSLWKPPAPLSPPHPSIPHCTITRYSLTFLMFSSNSISTKPPTALQVRIAHSALIA